MFTDGRAVFIRLSRQINMACNKIKKLVRLYNGAGFGQDHLPSEVSERDMFDPTSPLYSAVETVEPVKYFSLCSNL